MQKAIVCLLAAAVACPSVSLAQSSIQVKYCNDLADAYRKARLSGKPVQPNAGSAVAQCPTNPADSIPTLESALKAMGVDLPPR
jgi:hypothetical protein